MRLLPARLDNALSGAPQSGGARILWMLNNLLLLVGLVLLLYGGGLYAGVAYQRYAARGDTSLPALWAVDGPLPSQTGVASDAPIGAAPSHDGQIVGAVPDAAQAAHRSAVTRVIIPSIGVDSKVVEVGWEIRRQVGQPVAFLQVPEYAVGQNSDSANPGEGGNIVLDGHVAGRGKVFKDLYYVKPGDPIILYSAGKQYQYIVRERLVLQEEGVSAQQQAGNARYIAPTPNEVVTLVTCWPLSGPNRFTQRVVVQALPSGLNAGISSSTVAIGGMLSQLVSWCIWLLAAISR